MSGVHGLTGALTSFVGRADEITQVVGLLGRNRLVTVTGAGGVGKTRLAAEVARRVAGQFADGVWLAELAGVPDPGPVAAAVARGLGVELVPGKPALAALAAALARRQLLLVLDNCEHVLAAVAELCGAMLLAADDVRVLATSREPLRAGGEARYRLGPLGLPETGGPVRAGETDAVTLFVERARMADPGFQLDARQQQAVGRLVRRLDGMPLAIELAAARAEAMGVAALADSVEKGFGLLAGGDRLAAERHQTLAATAEWSYRLLGERERAVFRRLAVLPGPFTLEAAEAVAGQDAGPAVLHLVDCSLLVPPRPDPDGRARYLMLQTLRGYALDLLATNGPEAAARRNEGARQRAGRDEGWAAQAGLAEYAVRVAEQAAVGMRSSAGEVDAARWLDAEDGVVHQALGWALECDPATAVRLALALAPWWAMRGRQASGYRLLTAAAALAPRDGPQWCAAQVWLGQVAVGSSESARLGHFTAAKDALAGRPPSPLLVRSLIGRAGCLANLESAAAAEQEARQALMLAREIGDQAGQARALRLLGLTAFYASDTERSQEWLRQALRIDPAAIPGAALRECITMLTVVLLESGELAEARHYGTRALALARQAGALRDQANGLMRLAHVSLVDVGLAHVGLAHVGLVDGRLTQAAGYLSEAIELASQTGGGVLLIDCLEMGAHLCAQTRRPADALTAWAAYATCLADSGLYDLPQDQRLREVPQREARRRLGPQKARAAERRGAAMGLATATEYVMMLVTAELEEAPPEADMARLSVRERELLTLVAQGHTNAQIAGRLYISVRTVGSHLDRIRDKTGCRRRADLTRLALQAGLV